jgi:hypothetical protein
MLQLLMHEMAQERGCAALRYNTRKKASKQKSPVLERADGA